MTRAPIRKSSPEKGMALLFVLFMLLVVLIGASTAFLRFKAQGLRQEEADMIWRGEQYERAIGLYYRKFGRYPTSIDQLVQGVNGVRFLRQAYKDPMNTEDGSWRLIYVTPAGQLIGSVRYITLQQMALEDQARIMGISLAQETGADNGQGNASGSAPGASDQNGNGAPLGAPPAPGSTLGGSSGSPSSDQSSQQSGTPPQPTPPQPNPFGISQQANQLELQTAENSGEVIGGFIVGVASKIDKPSLKVHKGGMTYKQWEFIYNPLEQVQTVGGGTVGVIGGIIGTNPIGPLPGAPVPQPPQQPPQPQIPQIPQSQQ
jgi:hypothetical protein